MHLYRLCMKEVAGDLTGKSGMRVNSHWTTGNHPCIYAHSSVANCMLENRMYRAFAKISHEMVMVEYELPDSSLQKFKASQKPLNLIDFKNPVIARSFGTRCLEQAKILIMGFPSTVLNNNEFIYLINTRHRLISQVQIVRIFKPVPDEALLNDDCESDKPLITEGS